VDLYLIHAPFFAKTKEELQTAWRDMEAVQKTGKAKSIGVSNFMQPQLETILEIAMVIPAVNQLEYHPYLQRENLIPWSESKGIVTAAYGPLSSVTKAKPDPLDPFFDRLMKKYKVGEEAVALRWCIQMGVVAVTTTGKKERLEKYLGCLDFELSEEEVDEIIRVGRTKHYRVYNYGMDYGGSKE
jgi:diketogulonate reductase-like aldo/keto reductase